MMFSKKQVSLALALYSASSCANWSYVAAQEELVPLCKTVETVYDFVLDDFISAPWYAHQQAENTFAPPTRNNCVRAEYELREEPTIPWGYTVDVYNSGRDDDGTFVEADLCAFQEQDEDPSNDGKLRVAPCFVPKAGSGSFWVVAYDESEGYALISAGQPTRPGVDGCLTGGSIDDQGLWIFSRSPVRDEGLINSVREIARDAGFDITVLNDVSHENCGDYGAPEPICQDVETSFPVWPFGNQDCDWVEKYSWFACFFHSDQCPDVCGKCD